MSQAPVKWLRVPSTLRAHAFAEGAALSWCGTVRRSARLAKVLLRARYCKSCRRRVRTRVVQEISRALAQAQRKAKRLAEAGAPLANAAFNLSQRHGPNSAEGLALKRAYHKWDEAVRGEGEHS